MKANIYQKIFASIKSILSLLTVMAFLSLQLSINLSARESNEESNIEGLDDVNSNINNDAMKQKQQNLPKDPKNNKINDNNPEINQQNQQSNLGLATQPNPKNPANTANINNYDPSRFLNVAKLQILDKNNSKVSLLDFTIGEKKQFADLEILVHKCWQSPPDQKPENKILLEVFEVVSKNNSDNIGFLGKKDDKKPNKRIFYGWLFSSAPSLSSIEHSIYDIIAISCKKK